MATAEFGDPCASVGDGCAELRQFFILRKIKRSRLNIGSIAALKTEEIPFLTGLLSFVKAHS